MTKKKSRFIVKLIAIILFVSFCTPVTAQATTTETAQPRASAYLWSYTSYICAMGNGDLEIWFEVTGTGTMADIGVLSIAVYESTDGINFTWVGAFRFTDYPNMLWHDIYFCMDHVHYTGVPGRYYKALVQVWAGPEDGGDRRYIYTPVELCT